MPIDNRYQGTIVQTAEETMTLCATLATHASSQNNFGVGGFLMDDNGTVLLAGWNETITSGDSGQHSERVLLEAYFTIRHEYYQAAEGDDRQAVLNYYFPQLNLTALPDLRELTLVSSLDPCVMCCGSIMDVPETLGGSPKLVISSSLDTYAGVTATMVQSPNLTQDQTIDSLHQLATAHNHPTMPPLAIYGQHDLNQKIITHALRDGLPEGLDRPLTPQEQKASDACLDVFTNNLAKVMSRIASSDTSLDLRDAGLLAEREQRIQQRGFNNTSSMNLSLDHPHDTGLAVEHLSQSAHKKGNKPNAAILLDSSGKLLAIAEDTSQTMENPLYTALANLIAGYEIMRIHNPELPHIAECTMHVHEPLTMMEYGRIGSAIEGERSTDAPFIFVHADTHHAHQLHTRKEALESWQTIAAPAFYHEKPKLKQAVSYVAERTPSLAEMLVAELSTWLNPQRPINDAQLILTLEWLNQHQEASSILTTAG